MMRDVAKIGHPGMGNFEFTLSSSGQPPLLEALVRQAYARRG